MQTKIIFDFEKKSNVENWSVVDDVVMGGKSSGLFELNDEKYINHFVCNNYFNK